MKPLVLWSAAAVLAVVASSAAVSAATSGTGYDVMSPADVSRALAGGAPVGPTAGAMPPSSVPSSASQVLDTPGGVVVVSCEESGPVLLRWAPKSGYRVDRAVDSPGYSRIVFETVGERDVIVVVRCLDGRARATSAIGSDDHGGGGTDDTTSGDPDRH